MKEIEFHKMEGAGNDFIVIDNREYGFSLDEIISFTPKLCDRKFGVGADGLLALEKPNHPDVNYTMIYRNADGSDAGMCGNGSRCLALFASYGGYPDTQTFNVHDAVYKAIVDKKEQQVSIHFPDVKPPERLSVMEHDLLQIYTGTEHVVEFVDEDTLELEKQLVKTGSKIRYSKEFSPKGSNVNFISLLSENKIKLQTYERGVEDLTLACGTGALASAIAAHSEGEHVYPDYSILVKGGQLGVSFNYDDESSTYKEVILKGPAHFVFKGIVRV